MAKNFFDIIEVELQRSMRQTEFGRDYRQWEAQSNQLFNQLGGFLTKRQARRLFTLRDCYGVLESISNAYYLRMGFYVAFTLISEASAVAGDMD